MTTNGNCQESKLFADTKALQIIALMALLEQWVEIVNLQYTTSIPDSNFLHTWVGKPDVLFGSTKYLAIDVTSTACTMEEEIPGRSSYL